MPRIQHGEPHVRFVLGLDDGPATMHTAHAAPVEMIEIPGPVDQVVHVSTILFCMWRLDEVVIHESPMTRSRTHRPPAGPKVAAVRIIRKDYWLRAAGSECHRPKAVRMRARWCQLWRNAWSSMTNCAVTGAP